MSDITMYYGEYAFMPIPLIGVSRVYNKTEDGRLLSATTKLSLDGTLTPYPTGDTGGIDIIVGLKGELENAFRDNGLLFKLLCNGNVLLSGMPKINSLSFKNSASNWVNSIGYTIDLEYEDPTVSGEFPYPNILSSSDNWNIEPADGRQYYEWDISAPATDFGPAITHKEIGRRDYKVTRNLSAVGVASYDNGRLKNDKEAWKYAEAFCSGNAAFPSGGLFGLTAAQSSGVLFNHGRVQAIDKQAGKYSLTDTWLLYGSGSLGNGYLATESYTINIQSSLENPISQINIQGQIQGLESGRYIETPNVKDEVFSAKASKWHNATGYFNAIQQVMYARVLTTYNTVFAKEISNGWLKRTVCPVSFGRTVGMNVANGSISYSYEFSNKLPPYVSGAYAESINFSADYPKDQFATINVLGRASGPVVQLMGTRTPYSLNMTVDLVVEPVSGYFPVELMSLVGNTNVNRYGQNVCPHNQIKTLISGIEENLNNNFNTLVKTDDKVTWSPHLGKYNRSVSWLYNSCNGSGTAVKDLI